MLTYFVIIDFYVGCSDSLPEDYTCTWSCNDWAAHGHCNKIWGTFSHITGGDCSDIARDTMRPIKNYCGIACNTCGTKF